MAKAALKTPSKIDSQSGPALTTDQKNSFNHHMAAADVGVICHIDQAVVHSIPFHIETNHSKWNVAEYLAIYGATAPLYSQFYEQSRTTRIDEIEAAANATPLRVGDTGNGLAKKSLASVFGIKSSKATRNAKGTDIQVSVIAKVDPNVSAMVPDADEDYVFDLSLTKDLVLAVELNMPVYFWGMHGTGKTSALEQFCARTGRPAIRIQHTATTEEAHILGQYVLKNSSTEFEPGPLAFAMRHGLVYIADEYDFAMPNVTAAYQPVMEGKPLVIKDAPAEWRVVRPHPNFRFAATGNTNGAGDDTGLYQGTQVQNAANYSRFGVTREVGYMSPQSEIDILIKKTGIEEADAKKLVSVANEIRRGFREGKLSATISPREVFNAGQIANAKGGSFGQGLGLAWSNRLSEVDRTAASAVIQRTFPT